MATKPSADPGADTPAPDAPRTPENTPVPGAGSWRWDTSLQGWLENSPDRQTETPLE